MIWAYLDSDVKMDAQSRTVSPGASIPMGQGGRVPPIFGLGGQYYECPPQYFKSNIGYFSSMLQICGYQVRFFQPPNTPKFVFGRGSAPDSAGGAYDAPPEPLVGWGGGHPLPIPFPIDAFSVSISAPRLSALQHKFLATPMGSGGLVCPPQPWREIDAYPTVLVY